MVARLFSFQVVGALPKLSTLLLVPSFFMALGGVIPMLAIKILITSVPRRLEKSWLAAQVSDASRPISGGGKQ